MDGRTARKAGRRLHATRATETAMPMGRVDWLPPPRALLAILRRTFRRAEDKSPLNPEARPGSHTEPPFKPQHGYGPVRF